MFDSEEEILKKIKLGEDNTLELKAVTFRGTRIDGPVRNDLADEIAAFANTHDAVMIMGVDDRSKAIVGIPVDRLDQVEDFVREICNDSIDPPVSIRTYRMELPDEGGDLKPILKVEIPRSLFVHQSPGGYFHRQGSSKRKMKPEYLARLFQQRSQAQIIRFDEQSVPDTSSNDLSENLWKRFTTRSDEPDQTVLLKRSILVKYDNNEINASVTGILMCSEDPTEKMPNAFIEAVQFRGIVQDTNYQVNAKKIVGPLDKQIDDALEFVMTNQKVFAKKTPHRYEKTQFDERAVFEAIVNAVAHRDYSIHGSKIRLFMFEDRLEIYSPGALPNTVSIDTISMRQATRNELITSLLAECSIDEKTLGRKSYMEKRGDGVPLILRRSEELSGKKPEYKLIGDSELLLTIFAYEPENDNSSN